MTAADSKELSENNSSICGLTYAWSSRTRGDPESPLRWTCKSVRRLAAELQRQGHRVSHQLVSELLQELGYSLQGQPQDAGRRQPSGPQRAV